MAASKVRKVRKISSLNSNKYNNFYSNNNKAATSRCSIKNIFLKISQY